MANKTSSTERVQQALNQAGLDILVHELPASTRTAQAAAEAVGCQVGQIVKSLVFCTQNTQRPVLILTSGDNHVDEETAAGSIGENIRFADPDFVREATGFAIGGVSPVGLIQQVSTYIDRDLLDHSEIWAAAGTPQAVFRITPPDLVRITGGEVIPVS
jgi:prolyl-tRNA editing enzyme YbaK/EbsC (Cys-tRNA(Pro) deacylase)